MNMRFIRRNHFVHCSLLLIWIQTNNSIVAFRTSHHRRLERFSIITERTFVVTKATGSSTRRQLHRRPISSIRHVAGSNTNISPANIPTLTKSIDITSGTTIDDDPIVGVQFEKFVVPIIALATIATVGLVSSMGYTVDDIVNTIHNLIQNPQTVLQDSVDTIHGMGDVGVLYFGLIYVVAEILAIPAFPLTLSAGYLFGLNTGVAIVLFSATIAACIAFFIGKTILRSWVETIINGNPKLAKIDRAIGERGFKLLLLLRLSPIFPFAISNYVYGASSIDFTSYVWGTMLGFTPGTIAYVYTGMAGKELMFSDKDSSSQPWYVYAIGLSVLVGLLKVVSDVATGILQSIEDDDDQSHIDNRSKTP